MTTPELGSNAGFFKGARRKPATEKTRDLLKVVTPKARKPHKKKNIVHRGFSRIWRGTLVGVGSTFVALGILIAPLPGPLGMPVSIFGLIIVLRNSYWAKRKFVQLKKKHPNWIMPLRKLLRPKPKVASIFWQQALRTERLVLKAEGRILTAFRRKFLRKSKRTIFGTQSAK